MYHVWLYLKNIRLSGEDIPIGEWKSYPTLLEALDFCNRTPPPDPESQTWDIRTDSGKFTTHSAWDWEE